MRYVELHKTQTNNKKHSKKTIVFILVALCIVFAITGFLFFTMKSSGAKPALNQSLAPSMVRTMGSAIYEAIGRSPDIKASVSIIDLKSGGSYHYGSHDLFAGASVNKLVTATLLLNTIDQKKNSIYTMIDGQRASPLLTKMIEDSNNDAWTSINHYLTAEAIRSWAKQNMWESYNYDTNEIKSDDIAKLLAETYRGNLLSESSRGILLSHMHNANEESLIVKYIPKEVKIYHKAGWLDDTLNDAAIVDNGSRPFALVIFSEGNDIYASRRADGLFSDITSAALKAFSTN